MPKKELMSFEEMWAMLQETDRILKETAAAQKETTAAQKETTAAQKETDRILKETAAAQKENERLFDERCKKLDERIGYLGRSLGDVVELVLVPGICEKMNAYGHDFTKIGPNKIIDRANKRTLTEIDLLLENGDEAMAVEIKTDLSVKWVRKHLERLRLLRKHEKITGLKGKILYAAVAGISIDNDARDLALENGMYVISMMEDEERLEVAAPPKGKLGKW